jgi:dipeptidase
VAHLTDPLPACWVTGTSATCTGLFKPVYLDGAGLPDQGPPPDGTYDPETLWWAHERLHRAVIRDYPTRQARYAAERDALEATFRREAAVMRRRWADADDDSRAEALRAFTASCFRRAAEATADWTERVVSAPIEHRPPLPFALAWWWYNRQADFVL